MNRTHAWLAGTAALNIAALGCGAVYAQTGAAPNPALVTPSSGVPPAVTESSATPATDGSAASARVDRAATQRFINDAADTNIAEIAAARYAVDHSQSAQVKQFAQKMLHDHTTANDQLTMLAMAHGYGIPLASSQHDKASLRRLEQAHGTRFDADYSKAQARDHREALSMFRRAAQNARIAPQVRQFAQQALPVLQDHLRMANQLVVASEAGGNRSAG